MQMVTVVIAVGGYYAARYGSLQSVEHWSGRIVEKPSGTEHCCHCRQVCETCTSTTTDSQGRTSTSTSECNCTEVCDHILDYWWKLKISTDDLVTVKDCASSSSDEPSEWTHAQIGEAASVAHYYTNYLKADPESLFRHAPAARYRDQVPKFPVIYDYYKVDKVIGHGIEPPVAWQAALRELNAELGTEKQVDITLIVTQADATFAEAVEVDWLYGPKNSLVVIVGTADRQTISWARVVTISKVESLKTKLRTELPRMVLGDPAVIAVIGRVVQTDFVRTPMADFEYLASAATPSTGWLIVLYLLHVFASILLAVYFVNNRYTETGIIEPIIHRPLGGLYRQRYGDVSPFDPSDLRPGALKKRWW